MTARTTPQTHEVIRLRMWGTDDIYPLTSRLAPLLIGTSSACAVRLNDRTAGSVHAQLLFDDKCWTIRREAASTLTQDGAPRDRFILASGVEIGIGATTLVAESSRAAQLRGFVQRLLGWGTDRLAAVDLALRAIRMAMARRSLLVIEDGGDVVSVAHALHRHMQEGTTPFIVCDPRRRNTRANVRSPANLTSCIDAFSTAIDGTLCLLSWRLPRDVDEVIARACTLSSSVQIFVCMPSPCLHRMATLTGTCSIQVPPLQVREQELPRIVDEYAQDAIAALHVIPSAFTVDDQTWILQHASRSHHEIEKAALRLIALRTSKDVSEAAARLGMAPVSLARWLGRRPPLHLRQDVRVSVSPVRRSRARELACMTMGVQG